MTAGKGTACLLALGSALAVAATLFAQEQRLPTQPLQPGQPGQPGQRREVNKAVINEPANVPIAGNADPQLATCLIGDNQGEIALGQLAEQRAKDRDVKQFAEMMVRDHQQFVQQLERFARGNEEQGTVRPENRALPGSAPVGVPPGATTSTGREPLDGRGVNFVAIHEQIGKKCLELFEADLKQKEGAQFDKCYIGQQIGAHMHVLAELEVLRSHVSPELASVLDKGIETTKSHLEHAQKIAQALERS